MNILSSFLFILGLIQCSQAVLYAGDWEVFWDMPGEMTIASVSTPNYPLLSIPNPQFLAKQFETHLQVPPHMATTVYQDSSHAISTFIESASSRSVVEIKNKDGLYGTYDVTLDGEYQPGVLGVYLLLLAIPSTAFLYLIKPNQTKPNQTKLQVKD